MERASAKKRYSYARGCYGGMFNPLTQLPFPTYYAFMAFNELYRLGTEVKYEMKNSNGIYVLAT